MQRDRIQRLEVDVVVEQRVGRIVVRGIADLGPQRAPIDETVDGLIDDVGAAAPLIEQAITLDHCRHQALRRGVHQGVGRYATHQVDLQSSAHRIDHRHTVEQAEQATADRRLAAGAQTDTGLGSAIVDIGRVQEAVVVRFAGQVGRARAAKHEPRLRLRLHIAGVQVGTGHDGRLGGLAQRLTVNARGHVDQGLAARHPAVVILRHAARESLRRSDRRGRCRGGSSHIGRWRCLAGVER